jgi:hypothetical protein
LVEEWKECTYVINDVAHICIKPIGPFTVELKISFMVDFDIVFIALLYGLGGLEPRIRGRFGCVVIFKLFFYYVLYVC